MRNEKQNRFQSDILDPTIKICVPGRIITRSMDIGEPTLKKRKRETNKVVSTISALNWDFTNVTDLSHIFTQHLVNDFVVSKCYLVTL